MSQTTKNQSMMKQGFDEEAPPKTRVARFEDDGPQQTTLEDDKQQQSSSCCPITWRREKWCRGVAVLVTGIVLALLLILPNLMLSDSGTQHAMVASNIALGANGAFLLGGIVGVATNLGWWALLPGCVLQVLAIVMLALG